MNKIKKRRSSKNGLKIQNRTKNKRKKPLTKSGFKNTQKEKQNKNLFFVLIYLKIPYFIP